MIDPTLQYCSTCGMTWKPRLHHKILMLIRGEYSRTCPQCQTVMRFKLMHHVVKTETRGLKNRDRIWKNA